jgi:hypothetical protein
MAEGSDRVVHVTFNEETIVLRLADGCMLTLPLEWYPRLLAAPQKARGNWTVAGNGDAVVWPDIDEALHVATLLRRGGRAAPIERSTQ